MTQRILLGYLLMAIGLLFGACTVSVAPTPTPTPTQTEAPAADAITTTATLTATTAPIAAPGGVTTTTPDTGTGITTTDVVTAPLPPAGTAVTGTILSPTSAGLATPTAPPAAAVTTTGVITTVNVATGTGGVGTIFAVIGATSNLQTLASVLNAAGMREALELPGPFTFFAPTDDAFAALPAEQEEALLNDPAALASVLQYHVVIDRVTAEQLAQLGAALASSGQPITITLQADGSLLVNNARIVQSDVVASNGIIHVIDQVLMPPGQ
jgi:transforming growth factor-beta-induced protein